MEKRAWHILLVAELVDNAVDIRTHTRTGAIAGREVEWHNLTWYELKVHNLRFDAMVIIELAGSRSGLVWLQQREPQALPPILYLLPSADAESEAIAEQAGAFVLTLSALADPGPVLRSALVQTLHLGQARHMHREQQRILQSVHDAVIVVDTAGCITGWTGASEKLYGWSAQEALGKVATELLDSPISAEQRAQVLDQISQTGSFQIEIRQSNRAGGLVYVEVTGIPMHQPDGSLTGLVVANRDITVRKAAQEALQTSNRQLEAVLGSIAEVQISFECDWRFLAINPAAAKAFFEGRPMGDLLGRGVWEEYPREVGGLLYQKYHEAVSSGEPVHFEALVTPPGRWYEVHAFPHDSRLDVFMRDISERKQAEIERDRLMTALGHERVRLVYLVEGLRASEELYRATFDNASVGISHVSLNGAWLKVNDRLCEITGYSREELLRINFQAITVPEDLQMDMWHMGRMLRGEIPRYQIEKRYIHKDGHYIWIQLSAALQRDEYDHPDYIISVIQDITDRKRLEAHDHFLIELGDHLARAESPEEMIAWVVEGVGRQLQIERCMVVEVDALHDSSLVHADFHPDLPSLAGEYPNSIHQPGVVANLRLRRQVVVEDCSTVEQQVPLNEPMDSLYDTRAYVHTPIVRNEQWVGMLSVLSRTKRKWEEIDLSLLRSVTDLLWLNLEKIRLLDSLRESEERLRLALSSSGVTVFGQDDELRSTWVYNPDAGVSAAALLGLSEGYLFAPQDAARLAGLKRQVLTSGQRCRQEVQFEVEGQLHYYELVIEPARGADGSINGILASALDITERRRSEEAIKKYASRLERSNRDLEDFAFIASHDLQEPLRKVRSFARILEESDYPGLDDMARSYLARMLNSTVRMQQMIDDLLAYSRVTTQGRTFAPVDLGVIVSEVLTDLELSIQQSVGQVEVSALPIIEADRLQMQQLLQNLIGNALKFHLPDQPPRVSVSARQPSAQLIELVVKDEGIGFAEEYLERIFQPFQRLHGRSEYEGSGIGLAICRKIAERHGGSITGYSQPGQGSEFVVKLPVKQPGV